MGIKITYKNGVNTLVVDGGVSVKNLQVRDGEIISGTVTSEDGSVISYGNGFITHKTATVSWWKRFCLWIRRLFG
jgi:hypothetical protein